MSCAIPGAVVGSIWNASTGLSSPYGTVCECWCSPGWYAALVFSQDARLCSASSLGPAARALRSRVSYELTDEGLNLLQSSSGLSGGKRARQEAEGQCEEVAEEEVLDAGEEAEEETEASSAPLGLPAEAIYRVRILAGAGEVQPSQSGQAASASSAALPAALEPTDVLAQWGSGRDTFTLVPASYMRPLQSHTAALLQQQQRQQPLALAAAPPPGVPSKYWHRRHALWRRWDEGVGMDAEGWYSTTPEVAALHMAAAAGPLAHAPGCLVLELFAGCGGNSIGWLRHLRADACLLAVEVHLPRLLQAKANAAVYASELGGAAVVWVHGDAVELLAGLGKAAAAAAAAAAGSSGSGGACREAQLARLRALGQQPVTVAAALAALVGGGAEAAAPAAAVPAPTAATPPRPGLVDVLFLAPPWGGGKYKAACSSGKGKFSLSRDLRVSGQGGSLSGLQLLSGARAQGVAGLLQAFLPKHTAAQELGQALGMSGGGGGSGSARGEGLLPRPSWVELRTPWMAPGIAGLGGSARRSASSTGQEGEGDGEGEGEGEEGAASERACVELLGVDGRAIGLFLTVHTPSE